MITKSGAKLLILKAYTDPVLLKLHRYGHERVGVVTNRTRAVLTLNNIEPDPIWLLDLRRNGVPFIWLWGTENQWRFIQATDVTGTKAKISENVTEQTSTQFFQDKMAQLKEHEFDSALVAKAYDDHRTVFLND